MKRIPLKHPYYINKDLVRYRRPQDWAKQGGVRAYSAWPPDEREICRKCDAYIAEMREHPPRVLGWLSRGIDKDRMLKVKREIERRENGRRIKHSSGYALVP